jgi:hypothetical protein
MKYLETFSSISVSESNRVKQTDKIAVTYQ